LFCFKCIVTFQPAFVATLWTGDGVRGFTARFAFDSAHAHPAGRPINGGARAWGVHRDIILSEAKTADVGWLDGGAPSFSLAKIEQVVAHGV